MSATRINGHVRWKPALAMHLYWLLLAGRALLDRSPIGSAATAERRGELIRGQIHRAGFDPARLDPCAGAVFSRDLHVVLLNS
jgi:hypothetical protein